MQLFAFLACAKVVFYNFSATVETLQNGDDGTLTIQQYTSSIWQHYWQQRAANSTSNDHTCKEPRDAVSVRNVIDFHFLVFAPFTLLSISQCECGFVIMQHWIPLKRENKHELFPFFAL